MSNKFQGAVTTVGTDLINQAIVNNTKMQFLRIIGSSTVYTADQLAALDDTAITGASHNQDGHVSNVTRKDKTTIATELVFDGSNVKADYQLNTILILATVDGKDHLFGVLKSNQPQYMNAYDGNEAVNLQINCSFKIANTDHVDITVDSAGTLTVDDYNRLHEYTDKVGKDTGTAANSYTDSKVAAASSAATAANAGEAAARSAADSAASASLAAEVKARAAADVANSNVASSAAASLATQITNNKSVFNTYSSAANSSATSMAAAIAANSTAASSATTAEAAARAKADTTEATTRSAADTSLASSVASNASAIAANSTAAKSYAASAATSAASIGTTAASSAAVSAKAAITAESTARSDAIVAEADLRAKRDTGLQQLITVNKTAIQDNLTKAIKAQNTADGKITANASAIVADTDLNTVQTVGFYSLSAAVTPTVKNSPFATGTLGLTVLKLADVFQFLVEYSSGTRRIFFRELISEKWTVWTSLAQLEGNQTFTGKQTFTQAPLTKIPKDTTAHAVNQFDVGNGNKNAFIAAAGPDANGDGIALGAGGVTLVGSGESASTLLTDILIKSVPSNLATVFNDPSSEIAALMGDGSVYVISNFQNNDANCKPFIFDTDGNLKIVGDFIARDNLTVATQQWVNTNMSNALALKADMYDSGDVTTGITLLNGGKWTSSDPAHVGHYRVVKVGSSYLISVGGSVMGFTAMHKAMFSLPANIPWPTKDFLTTWIQDVGSDFDVANWQTFSGAAPTFGVDSVSANPTATMAFQFHFMWWAPTGWTP